MSEFTTNYSEYELDQLIKQILDELDAMYGKEEQINYDLLNVKSTNPIDFYNRNAKEVNEVCKYSLLSDRPSKQIEYEMRMMGIQL